MTSPSSAINWFPGHMVAAQREAEKTLGQVDVVIEVLDARCPKASCNPMIDRMRKARSRACLKVLNKADVADPNVTEMWLQHFNAQPNVRAIALSCKKPGDAMKVLSAAQSLAPHRNSFLKPLRMMAMGVPNVGKSTLINALLKRRTATVGDEPAVTKVIRKYVLSDTQWLFDTPGLMWPKIDDPNDGMLLAAAHTIGVNAYHESDVAIYLSEILRARYAEALQLRYDVQAEATDAVGVIEGIAAKRGWKIKGGEADFEKAAKALLVDFRSGLLGRISLELPRTA